MIGLAEKPDEFEKSFQDITLAVFGKRLAGYKDFEAWLTKDVSNNQYGKSIMSGQPVFLPPFDFYEDIKHNILTIEEAYDIHGKKHLSSEELRALSFSNAKSTLQKLSTTTPNTIYGECSNMIDSTFYYSSNSCYKSCATVRSKYSFYSFWPRDSSYVLGCFYTFSSQFCIKCYNSENLNRCFELSDCNNCTDSMFCHNCENLQNCMFCFNVKAKRYAIANVELGREKYLEIKKMIMNEIMEKLEKNKSLELSVFNLYRG